MRAAIDVFEQIAAEPYQAAKKQVPGPVEMVAQPPPPVVIPIDKITHTIKNAAEALGVSRGTIWKAIADGKLSAVKLGRRTLIQASSLRDWLASLPVVKGSG